MSQVKNCWLIKSNSGKIPCKAIAIYLIYVALSFLARKDLKKKIFIFMCYICIEYSFNPWPKKKYTSKYFALVVSLLIFRQNSLTNIADLLLTLKWADKQFAIFQHLSSEFKNNRLEGIQ